MTRYYLTPDGSTAHSSAGLCDAYPYVKFGPDPWNTYDGYRCNGCMKTYDGTADVWTCALGGDIFCPTCMERMTSGFDPAAPWFASLLAAVNAGYYVQDAL